MPLSGGYQCTCGIFFVLLTLAMKNIKPKEMKYAERLKYYFKDKDVKNQNPFYEIYANCNGDREQVLKLAQQKGLFKKNPYQQINEMSLIKLAQFEFVDFHNFLETFGNLQENERVNRYGKNYKNVLEEKDKFRNILNGSWYPFLLYVRIADIFYNNIGDLSFEKPEEDNKLIFFQTGLKHLETFKDKHYILYYISLISFFVSNYFKIAEIYNLHKNENTSIYLDLKLINQIHDWFGCFIAMNDVIRFKIFYEKQYDLFFNDLKFFIIRTKIESLEEIVGKSIEINKNKMDFQINDLEFESLFDRLIFKEKEQKKLDKHSKEASKKSKKPAHRPVSATTYENTKEFVEYLEKEEMD